MGPVHPLAGRGFNFTSPANAYAKTGEGAGEKTGASAINMAFVAGGLQVGVIPGGREVAGQRSGTAGLVGTGEKNSEKSLARPGLRRDGAGVALGAAAAGEGRRGHPGRQSCDGDCIITILTRHQTKIGRQPEEYNAGRGPRATQVARAAMEIGITSSSARAAQSPGTWPAWRGPGFLRRSDCHGGCHRE